MALRPVGAAAAPTLRLTRVDEGSLAFAQDDGAHVARTLEVQHDDGDATALAQIDGADVHDAQALVDHFVVREAFDARPARD